MKLQLIGLPVLMGLSCGLCAQPQKESYLCEILFRKDTVIFLAQVELPRSDPQDHTIAAVGFDDKKTPHPPPDPGYVRGVRQLEAIAKDAETKAPLASRTHFFGADADVDELNFEVRVSDLGTGGQLPSEAADVVYICWAGVNPSYPLESAIFRIQMINGTVKPLRDDYEHWNDRVSVIRKEILQRRNWLTEDPQRLAIVASVLQEDSLLDQLRGQIVLGLNRKESLEGREMREVMSAISVLILNGDPKDLAFLKQAVEREEIGSRLVYFLDEIVKRFALPESIPLIRALVAQRHPIGDFERLERLRRLDDSIAKRMGIDEALIPLLRTIRINPEEIGMAMCESALLERIPKAELSVRDGEKFQEFIRNRSGRWYFPTEEAREQGIEKLTAAMMERLSVIQNRER